MSRDVAKRGRPGCLRMSGFRCTALGCPARWWRIADKRDVRGEKRDYAEGLADQAGEGEPPTLQGGHAALTAECLPRGGQAWTIFMTAAGCVNAKATRMVARIATRSEVKNAEVSTLTFASSRTPTMTRSEGMPQAVPAGT